MSSWFAALISCSSSTFVIEYLTITLSSKYPLSSLYSRSITSNFIGGEIIIGSSLRIFAALIDRGNETKKKQDD